MKERRVILLPGFGEDHRCFRNLHPLLEHEEHLHVDYRPVLRKLWLPNVNLDRFTELLIDLYRIEEEDILIGHSMGGYFGLSIATRLGNRVCLIGSFSDPDRIYRMSDNYLLNLSLAGIGFVKSPLMRRYISERNRKHPYYEEMMAIQRNFSTFTNSDFMKLSKLSFGPRIHSAHVDVLRLHAHDDRIVAPPEEHYIPVPGGHFSLILHPEEVAGHYHAWL